MLYIENPPILDDDRSLGLFFVCKKDITKRGLKGKITLSGS